MANTDRVNGFRPVSTLNGSPYNGAYMEFWKAAGTTVTNDMAVGDMVTFDGTGGATGIPGVTVATAGNGNASIGVVVGFEPDPNYLERTWVDGADTAKVYVCVDPMVVFEVQADEAVAVTAIGTNFNMVKTSAMSRTSGASGQEMDGTVSNAADDQLKLVGFPQIENNTVNLVDNKVLVVINNHIFNGGTGTAGV